MTDSVWTKEALKQGHKCPVQLQPGIPRKSESRWHRLHLAVWGAGWRAGLVLSWALRIRERND